MCAAILSKFAVITTAVVIGETLAVHNKEQMIMDVSKHNLRGFASTLSDSDPASAMLNAVNQEFQSGGLIYHGVTIQDLAQAMGFLEETESQAARV